MTFQFVFQNEKVIAQPCLCSGLNVQDWAAFLPEVAGSELGFQDMRCAQGRSMCGARERKQLIVPFVPNVIETGGTLTESLEGMDRQVNGLEGRTTLVFFQGRYGSSSSFEDPPPPHPVAFWILKLAISTTVKVLLTFCAVGQLLSFAFLLTLICKPDIVKHSACPLRHANAEFSQDIICIPVRRIGEYEPQVDPVMAKPHSLGMMKRSEQGSCLNLFRKTTKFDSHLLL